MPINMGIWEKSGKRSLEAQIKKEVKKMEMKKESGRNGGEGAKRTERGLVH
nr:hypothetical protein [uncultured archaeon]